MEDEDCFYDLDNYSVDPVTDRHLRTIASKILEGQKNNETVVLPPNEVTYLAGWARQMLASPLPYDPAFGDDRVCKCGHKYYRHFDSYENMYPVGCKYCACSTFETP